MIKNKLNRTIEDLSLYFIYRAQALVGALVDQLCRLFLGCDP